MLIAERKPIQTELQPVSDVTCLSPFRSHVTATSNEMCNGEMAQNNASQSVGRFSSGWMAWHLVGFLRGSEMQEDDIDLFSLLLSLPQNVTQFQLIQINGAHWFIQAIVQFTIFRTQKINAANEFMCLRFFPSTFIVKTIFQNEKISSLPLF